VLPLNRYSKCAADVPLRGIFAQNVQHLNRYSRCAANVPLPGNFAAYVQPLPLPLLLLLPLQLPMQQYLNQRELLLVIFGVPLPNSANEFKIRRNL
jgi:hypothetical protein